MTNPLKDLMIKLDDTLGMIVTTESLTYDEMFLLEKKVCGILGEAFDIYHAVTLAIFSTYRTPTQHLKGSLLCTCEYPSDELNITFELYELI